MRYLPRGISAIELLIALSILAVLFGVAIPSLSGAFEAARSGSAQAALVGSYMAAVDNATNSGTRAVLCPSSDGANCLADPDWSGGWIAFLDIDGDREHQANEPVVSQHGALEGKVRLRSTVGRTRIVIQPSWQQRRLQRHLHDLRRPRRGQGGSPRAEQPQLPACRRSHCGRNRRDLRAVTRLGPILVARPRRGRHNMRPRPNSSAG